MLTRPKYQLTKALMMRSLPIGWSVPNLQSPPVISHQRVRLRVLWKAGYVTFTRHVTRAEAEAMLPAFALPQVEKVEIVP